MLFRSIARIRGIKKERINEVIKLVELEGSINDKISKYSLGMKQRLGLAAALLSSPKLLVLDEPTNGLDPNGIIEIRRILKNLSKSSGMGVFVSSHILSEIQELCDTVAFIEDGKITEIETLANIRNSFFYYLETDVTKETTKILKEIDFLNNFKV